MSSPKGKDVQMSNLNNIVGLDARASGAESVIIPVVVDKEARTAYDLFTHLFNEKRIIYLVGPIGDTMATAVCAQIMELAERDDKKPIVLYINSPGGSVTAGLAIYDAMQNAPCPVNTYCSGIAASMAAVLLAAGTQRSIGANSMVMIHEPSDGNSGTALDMEINNSLMQRFKRQLNEILANHTGQTVSRVQRDTERDYWMSAKEAQEYGIVDTISVANTGHNKKPYTKAPRAVQ